MKLIDILVQELPKRGGWPDGAEKYCSYNGEAGAYKPGGIEIKKALITGIDTQICDVVYAEQYEAALAAKNEGWIEWSGGECPPVSTNTVVDVKFKNGNVQSGYPAGEYSWEHAWQDCNIIAYRLHKPQEAAQPKADEEADLNECIGQGVAQVWNGEGRPTIGTKCEHHSGGQWEVVTIAGIYENIVTGFTDYWMVKEDGSSYTVGNPYRFRPIRSEADRKRDEAVEAIDRYMPEFIPDTPNDYYNAKKIYDAIAAGKIPGVKLED